MSDFNLFSDSGRPDRQGGDLRNVPRRFGLNLLVGLTSSRSLNSSKRNIMPVDVPGMPSGYCQLRFEQVPSAAKVRGPAANRHFRAATLDRLLSRSRNHTPISLKLAPFRSPAACPSAGNLIAVHRCVWYVQPRSGQGRLATVSEEKKRGSEEPAGRATGRLMTSRQPWVRKMDGRIVKGERRTPVATGRQRRCQTSYHSSHSRFHQQRPS